VLRKQKNAVATSDLTVWEKKKLWTQAGLEERGGEKGVDGNLGNK